MVHTSRPGVKSRVASGETIRRARADVRERLRTYRAIGYARGEAPVSEAEVILERTVEYDEEALRYFEEPG